MAFFRCLDNHGLNETESKNRNSTGYAPDPHNNRNKWLADVCVCAAHSCGGVCHLHAALNESLSVRPPTGGCPEHETFKLCDSLTRYIIYFEANWRYRYLCTFHRAEYWIVMPPFRIPHSILLQFDLISSNMIGNMIILLRSPYHCRGVYSRLLERAPIGPYANAHVIFVIHSPICADCTL